MRNILFEQNDLLPTVGAAPRPATLPLPVGRRLLRITLALQLSGAPPSDAEVRRLLTQYVAGTVSLAQIMPLVW